MLLEFGEDGPLLCLENAREFGRLTSLLPPVAYILALKRSSAAAAYKSNLRI